MALFRPGQTTGTSSFAGTASYAENAGTASFVTASNVWGPFGSNSILSASYASSSTSASYALTASYAENAGVPGGSNTQIQFNSGSEFSGSTNFTFDYVNNITYLTGSSWVSGSSTLTGSMYVSGAISASYGASTVGFYGTASWAVSASWAEFSDIAGGLLPGAPVPAALPEYSVQYNSGSNLAGSEHFLYKYESSSLQQGLYVTASGIHSHAEGYYTHASGAYSHAEGLGISGSESCGGGGGLTYYGADNVRFGNTVGGLYIETFNVFPVGTPDVGWTIEIEDLTTPGQIHTSIITSIAQIPNFGFTTTRFFFTDPLPFEVYSASVGKILIVNAIARFYQPTSVPCEITMERNLAIGSGSHAEGHGTIAIADASHAEGIQTRTGLLGLLTSNNTSTTLEFHNGIDYSNYFNSANPLDKQLFAYDTVAGVYYGEFADIAAAPFLDYSSTSYTAPTFSLNLTSPFATTNPLIIANEYINMPALLATAVFPYSGGLGSHTEGSASSTFGRASHAEGQRTRTYGVASHTEGFRTLTYGDWSHAEGGTTITEGDYSHAEGSGSITRPQAPYSHAEGELSITFGKASHAEGRLTQASGVASHTEGVLTYTFASGSHAEGIDTFAYLDFSHTEGRRTITAQSASHAEGFFTVAGTIGYEGDYTDASPDGIITIIGNVSGDFQIGEYVVYDDNPTAPTLGVEVFKIKNIQLVFGPTKTNITLEGATSGPSGKTARIARFHQPRAFVKSIVPLATIYTSSHAEGHSTSTPSIASHAEGFGSTAYGHYSHAEGEETGTFEQAAHSEGYRSKAFGYYSHAEGGLYDKNFSPPWFDGGIASGNGSHAEGTRTLASGNGSHAEGYNTTASGYFSHAEGGYIDPNSLTFHPGGKAIGNGSHAEGKGIAVGIGSHAEGQDTIASGSYSHAEGAYTTASGNYSHAEGGFTFANGIGSHAEGQYTTASGDYSHTEGRSTYTVAGADAAHAEGYQTTASADYAHAEGHSTYASGEAAHTQGQYTTASGNYSHAEGSSSYAVGVASHAGGLHTIAYKDFSTTIGQYNINNNTTDIFVIGDGTDDGNRHDLLNASLGVIRVTGSAIVSSSLNVIGISNVTGSNNITGSWDLKGDGHVTGSFDITGSYDLKGVGTVTGSLGVTGSLDLKGVGTVTGSLGITGSYDLKGVGTVTGSFDITGSLVANYASLTGSLTGSFLGTGSGDFTGQFTGSMTGSFIGTGSGFFDGFFTGSLTGSFIGTGSGNFTGLFTGSNPNGVSFYGTSSWAVSASIAETASFVTGSIFTGTNVAATASLALNNITTASVSVNVITFTKGDGTSFPITIDTGSADITEVTAGTALTGGGSSGNVTLNVDLAAVSTSMAGYGFSNGDITEVIAGNGIDGGGTSGAVTLDLNYTDISASMAGYGFGSGGGGGGGDITDVNAGDGILVDNPSGPAPTVNLNTGSAHFIAGVSALTGSLLTTTSFNSWTGSNSSQFAGTASYVTGSIFSGTNLALSASYSVTSSFTETASFAETASAVNVTLSSNVDERLPIILAYTSSNTGAKLAYIDAGFDYNTSTNALYVPSNGAFVIGNTTLQSSVATFGSAGNPNHVVKITGSLNVSKSVNVDGTVTAGFGADTVGFIGTASWAVSASQALTASFVSGAFMQGGNSFATGALLGTNDLQDLSLETNGTTRMFISSSGMIFIHPDGLTTQQFSGPNARLQIYTGTGANTGVGVRSTTIYFYPPSSQTTASLQYGSNGLAAWQLRNLGTAAFQIRSTPGGGTNTALMHLSSGSNGDYGVGILTENPQYTLDVSGSARITGSFYLPSITSQSQNNVLVIDTGSGQIYYTASSAIGGGGVPGGALRSIQFNSESIFSGSTNFSFDETTNSVYITGSLTVSGSNTFRNIGPAEFTGSIAVTENVIATSFTGSLLGTASYVTGSIFTSTNQALSASYALTASYAANVVTYSSNEGITQSGTTFKLGDNSSIGAYNLIPFAEDRYIDLGDANNSFFITKQSSFRFKFSGSGQLVLSEYNAATSFQGSSGTSIGVLHTDNTGRIFVSSSGGGTTFTYNSTSSVIGDGTNTSYNINHGFNTRNLHITVYESGSNGETVYPDIRRINENTASIIFANPPASNEYIVYISQ